MSQDTTRDGREEQTRESTAETGTSRRSFMRAAGAGALAAGLGTAGVTVGAAQESGAMTAVAFDFSGLPELARGHYEGWAIFGEEKVSTGTFSKGDEYVFEVDRDLSMADEFVVTIEPDGDDDPAPSGVVVLAGPVEDGTADLSFPVDFSAAAGSYILATPTNGGGSDELSGVWFPAMAGKPPALDLPELPAGWTYEAWTVHGGMPISTGRFDDPSSGDDDASYAGPQSPPDFPGADFITNAPDGLSFPTDLTDGESKVVVSVEPELEAEDGIGPDPTGPAPFQIKPLVGQIPADGTDHTHYDLQRNAGTLPSGTATVEHSEPTVGVSVDRVMPDGTAEATITLSSAPEGISGYEMTVTVDDIDVATITDAGYPESLFERGVDVAADGSAVSLTAVDTGETVQAGATGVELATVEFDARSAGQTSVAVEIVELDSDAGTDVPAMTTAGTLSVAPVEAIDGTLPRDIDGDGTYEDLNGNGRIDSDDVVKYFNNYDDPVITDHVSAYDYNGNDEIDFDDVVWLFQEM